MPEKSSVNDQKIENLLNLALDVTETERKNPRRWRPVIIQGNVPGRSSSVIMGIWKKVYAGTGNIEQRWN